MAPDQCQGCCRSFALLFVCISASLLLASSVEGHSYLLYPPSRGYLMWSPGRDWPANSYNGQGRENVCGDGNQASGFPTFSYRGRATQFRAGDTVEFQVRSTVAHWGRFEFRICRYTGAETTASVNQNCFNRIVLTPSSNPPQSNVAGNRPWFWVGLSGLMTVTQRMRYIIPSDLNCDGSTSFCVLQFTYRTGNSCQPDNCPVGTAGNPMFCKPELMLPCNPDNPQHEVFRNCADIVVWGGSGRFVPPPVIGGINEAGMPVAPRGGQCGLWPDPGNPNQVRQYGVCTLGGGNRQQCCSSWGWCGESSNHCDPSSCKPEYGRCH